MEKKRTATSQPSNRCRFDDDPSANPTRPEQDVVPSTMRVRVAMPPECPALKSLMEIHKNVKANEVTHWWGDEENVSPLQKYMISSKVASTVGIPPLVMSR